jgi:hypothetical protein
MKTKSVFLAFAMLFSFTLAFAQTEKGNMLLGGTAGFDVQFEDPDNLITIDVSPTIGFFVADNLALGGALTLGTTKAGDFSLTNYGIAPFGRYYFGTGMTRIFIHGQFGFAGVKFDLGGDNEETSSGTALLIGPGVSFFLNKHVAIEGVLGYTKQFGDVDTSDLGLRFGVQAYFGGE